MSPRPACRATKAPSFFTAITSLAQDLTVLFIEYDIELVFRLASGIIVMVNGSSLMEGG